MKKMDIYRKRQISALLLLVVFIFLIVMMVKCTAKLTHAKDDPDKTSVQNEEVNDDTEEDSSLNEDLSSDIVHSSTDFIPAGELVFEPVQLEDEDVSLMNARYIDDVVIVGDSISKGYSVYGRLSEDNVLAVGSIGVRNVLEADFPYQGYELKVTDILSRKKPKYIFVSLGMNDINLRTEEQYTADFTNFISEIKNATPDSYVIVTAITPVSRQTNFTQNDKIDQYNEALRKMVYDLKDDKIYYVNAAKYLKGSDNYLIPELSSGDGIHLATLAYDRLLTYMLTMLEWI